MRLARNLLTSIPGVLIALLGLPSCSKSDYSAQYVTLPSGAKAYCNRQGYREVRATYSYEPNTLVTDHSGNFVTCDARVGPEWDNARTSSTGRLLAPEQMDAALAKRQEEEENSPEALEQRRVAENNRQRDYYAEEFINPACTHFAAQEQAWFGRLTDQQKQTVNWAEKKAQYDRQCKAETDQATAAWEADKQAKRAAQDSVQAQEQACRAPYEQVRRTYEANPTPEGGQLVNDASVRMSACIAAIQ